MSQTEEPQLHYLEYYEDFLAKVRVLSRKIREGEWQPEFIIGVGRGGLVPAVYISHQLEVPMLSIDHSAKVPGFADELLGKVAGMTAEGKRLLFVDDINDSGGTIEYIRNLLGDNGCDAENLRFAVLINNTRSKAVAELYVDAIDRDEDKRWFVFPWESVGTKDAIVEEARSVPERLG
ncbi:MULTISPECIES: phosphoribosyltransferase [Novosphingobium]|jgi:hypoxanthine phosphoribosyltransferase|uniref:Phosphoribosyltransferase n=1 Tax=Novosphingobium resinovorum TaxID=158500 RepID=A0A031K559_9SPHN|nr:MULTISPECIES: phosphoribosyltransferase family protein [Novosphingobium]AOR75439.1 phosphoribosyltransferase [Novosphingobium resinovorum]EZP84370.1 Phosphoribosyltransferase [Novosphingobium resinovorum]MBF7010749.1 phosphoribosyltransferase [Novosphingobium sp. HR1a]WJM28746.1 phosphoribosyltransferase family protein [Novosphingobium resinovorum]GLK43356.1 xanthine phosphoribosyltransferase [Novosphingobium resinovorum]